MTTAITNGFIELPQGKIATLNNHYDLKQSHILAIHGWLDNAASFIPLMQSLPHFNWTAIDLPGHGHSFHRPQHSHYHFIDWVSDLATLIQQEFTEKVTLVGHSLGGMLATVIAGLYPELISKLVLIDSAGLVVQDENEDVKTLREALDSRSKQLKKYKTHHISIQAAIKARAQASDMKEASVKLLVERNLLETEKGFQWLSDNRLRTRSPIRLSRSQAKSIITNIECPVLLCLAEQGYDSIKQALTEFRPDYSNLRLENVAGGHHCHMDEVQSTAYFIDDFLK